MLRWLEGVIAESPSEVLYTIAGKSTSAETTSGTTNTGTRAGTNVGTTTGTAVNDSSDDMTLELWLGIGIPVVSLILFAIALFLYCKRRRRNPVDFHLEAGSPTVPGHPFNRRKGGGTTRMVLTTQDEEALAAWRINTDTIVPIRPLGAGAYGTVWLATYLGETVVVKKLSPPLPTTVPRTKSWRKNLSRPSACGTGATAGSNSRSRTKSRGDQSALPRFVAEIRFLATLSHPKIVAFYGVAWTSPLRGDATAATDLQMVLEYMSGGDLRQYLARTRSDVRARAWGSRKLAMALDIAEAIAYLHARQPQPILHRDLKSSNILLDATLTAKVADFGVSRYGLPHVPGDDDDDDDDDASSGQFAMTRSIGTSRWIAPEVLAGHVRYSTAIDMYSFGVLLSELDSHELPFADVTLSNGQPLPESAVVELLRTGALRPSLSTWCPKPVAALLMKCMALEPLARPTACVAARKLRTLVERERRVSDIGDDVSTSDQNSFLGTRDELGSFHTNSVTSSNVSIERGFHYAVLEEP